MLSQTQRWRHLKSRSGNRHRRRHEEQYLQHNIYPLPEEKIQEYVEHEQIIPPIVSLPKTNQTEILTESKSVSHKSSCKVKFNPVIRVCLVPCRADFRGDFYILFWGRDDYQTFKEDALQELREHWLKHHKTVKEAIFDLYQPAPIKEPQGTAKLLTHVDSVAHLSVMANLNKQLAEEVKEKCNKSNAKTLLTEEGSGSISPTCNTINNTNSINGSRVSIAHGSVQAAQSVGCMQSPLCIGDIRTGQPGSTPLAIPDLSGYTHSRQGHGHHHVRLPVEHGESMGLLGILAESTVGDTTVPVSATAVTTATADGTPPVSSTAQFKYDSKPNHSETISALRLPSSTTSASEGGVEEEVVSPFDSTSTIASPSPRTPPPHSREHITPDITETEVTTDSSSLSTPPLHQQQQQQAGSRDNGNAGSTVRIRLLEDSPCSSVSSFEPPILIC